MQVTTRTAMISIVSPNNPTGAVAQAQDLATISAAAPHALLLVDLAYEEFAQDPLTAAAISLPNAIIIRTFSKAFGLAGMRIGYAIVPESAASAMRATGSPYSVSSMSIAAAQQAMACPASWLSETLSRVRYEREQLRKLLLELGATPGESQGNFLLAEFRDCQWVWRALAGLGIAVRRFSAPNLQRSLRITCPGQEIAFTRLIAGLNAALRPQALFIAVDSNQDTLHRLSCRIPTAIIPRSANQSAAIQSAVQQLNASHAWMLCDTPEKIAASRAAGIVPLAIASNTADKAAFESCGAARVLDTIAQLEGMLP